MILLDVVSMKFSRRLLIVESVNTQWVIFSLGANLCGQLMTLLKAQMYKSSCYQLERLRAKLNTQESEPMKQQELREEIPPLGTFSNVGSVE